VSFLKKFQKNKLKYILIINHIKMSLYATDQISEKQFNRLMTSINDSYIINTRKKIKEIMIGLTFELNEGKKPPIELVAKIGKVYKLYRDLHKRLSS
tara:strand:+ start:12406 stop:12696 length:291 start_codon:yes stop_codon:yes gene_type:complete